MEGNRIVVKTWRISEDYKQECRSTSCVISDLVSGL